LGVELWLRNLGDWKVLGNFGSLGEMPGISDSPETSHVKVMSSNMS